MLWECDSRNLVKVSIGIQSNRIDWLRIKSVGTTMSLERSIMEWKVDIMWDERDSFKRDSITFGALIVACISRPFQIRWQHFEIDIWYWVYVTVNESSEVAFPQILWRWYWLNNSCRFRVRNERSTRPSTLNASNWQQLKLLSGNFLLKIAPMLLRGFWLFHVENFYFYLIEC